MIDYFIGFVIYTLFGSIYSIPLLYIICILIKKIIVIYINGIEYILSSKVFIIKPTILSIIVKFIIQI